MAAPVFGLWSYRQNERAAVSDGIFGEVGMPRVRLCRNMGGTPMPQCYELGMRVSFSLIDFFAFKLAAVSASVVVSR
jgi:hypothetical protein